MGEVGRGAARVAGTRARRKGARPHARAVSRVGEGHSGAREADPPPPRHDELLRRVGRHQLRSDYREAARDRTRTQERNVTMGTNARERQFLDPAVVARLGTLELRARTIVEGFLSGLHRSPFKGFSVEFAEYRQYLPGDDLSTIDWKVYARSDRYYVKKFEEETNVECRLLVDVSRSMAYGSRVPSKLEYASYLAASLAYLMQRQRDAVGIAAFDHRIVTMLPPSVRPGHLRAVLSAVEHLKAGERTAFARPFNQLAESLSKRGLVIVISDLLD